MIFWIFWGLMRKECWRGQTEMATLIWETGLHSVIILTIPTGHCERRGTLLIISWHSRTKPGVGCLNTLGNWVLHVLARGKYQTLLVGRQRSALQKQWAAWLITIFMPRAVQMRDNVSDIWVTDWDRKQVAITISLRASSLFYLTSQMALQNPSLQTTLQSDSPFLLPDWIDSLREGDHVSGLSKPGGTSTIDCWPVTQLAVSCWTEPQR